MAIPLSEVHYFVYLIDLNIRSLPLMIPIFATLIRVLWLIFEYPYLRRYRIKAAKDWDKNSAKLWDIANSVEPVGMILGFTNIGRIETGRDFIGWLGLALLLVGVAIRWTAIGTLGKYFTSRVLIKDDHRLVQSGLYKHLRHPAYTGALVAHLGLGLAFSNWISITLSFAPYLVAAMYRIHVEEQALTGVFGEEYLNYSRGTKRLIPKVY